VLSSAAVLLILQIVHVVLRRIGRRRTLVDDLVRRAHRPTQLLLVVVATYVSLQRTTQTGDWRGPLLHAVGLVGIAVGAWLVAELLMVLEEGALARIRTDVVDNRHARRIHTQVRLARRVTVMIIAVLAVGLMLLTFPAARTAGASLLASAASSARSRRWPHRACSATSSPASSSPSATRCASTTSSWSRASGAGSRRSPSATSRSGCGTTAG
jgi:hypothetical protein